MPRERYLTYYRDFAKYYGLELIESSAFYGSQLEGSELLNPVMDELAQCYSLNEVGACIFADWVEDFDPEYSALGPYVVDRYKLSSNLFNIVDQGLLSVITALKLAKVSLEGKNALILSFDQTTVTQFIGVPELRPDGSGAAALYLSASPQSAYFEIVEAEILDSQKAFLLDDLKKKLNLQDLSLIEVNGIGLMPFYKKLQDFKENADPGHYVLFVPDVETESCGYVLVYKRKKDENI